MSQEQFGNPNYFSLSWAERSVQVRCRMLPNLCTAYSYQLNVSDFAPNLKLFLIMPLISSCMKEKWASFWQVMIPHHNEYFGLLVFLQHVQNWFGMLVVPHNNFASKSNKQTYIHITQPFWTKLGATSVMTTRCRHRQGFILQSWCSNMLLTWAQRCGAEVRPPWWAELSSAQLRIFDVRSDTTWNP